MEDPTAEQGIEATDATAMMGMQDVHLQDDGGFELVDAQQPAEFGEVAPAPQQIQEFQQNEERVSLFYVRLPFPDLSAEDIQIERYRQEFDFYKLRWTLLSESERVTRMKRHEAQDNRVAAFQFLQSIIGERKQKQDIVSPIRAKLKRINTDMRTVGANTEEEISSQLRQLEDKLKHETMTLRQEKEVMRDMQKLESQRRSVRQYEKEMGGIQHSREEREQLRATCAEVDTEITYLKQEEDQARKIHQELDDAAKKISEALKEINEERTEIRSKKDEAYDSWQRAKGSRRAKLDQYFSAKNLKQQVVDLLSQGDVASAREKCMVQMEEQMEKLRTDKEYCNDYINLWAAQRRNVIAETDLNLDEPLDGEKKGAKGKGGKGGKAEAKGVDAKPEEQGDKVMRKAEAIYQRALQASQQESVLKAQADLKKKQAEKIEQGMVPQQVRAAAREAGRVAKEEERAKDPDANKQQEQQAPGPGGKQGRAKKEVDAFEVDIDYSALPIQKGDDEAHETEEQKKEKLREEQRKKAEEAEKRKQKKKEQNDRKKKRIAEQKQKDAADRQRILDKLDLGTSKEVEKDQHNSSLDKEGKEDTAAKPVPEPQSQFTSRKGRKQRVQEPVPKPVAQPSQMKKFRKLLKKHQITIVAVAVLTFTIVLAFLYMQSFA